MTKCYFVTITHFVRQIFFKELELFETMNVDSWMDHLVRIQNYKL